jgi:hypothetical protein
MYKRILVATDGSSCPKGRQQRHCNGRTMRRRVGRPESSPKIPAKLL